LRIDTHFHSCHSPSSCLSVDFLVERNRASGNRVLLCTDYKSTKAWRRLESELPGLIVVPSIELETDDADFLVYSTDADYIDSLATFDGDCDQIRRDDETAVIWAHPSISQREDLSALTFPERGPYKSPLEEMISHLIRRVDGLEIYNGTMLSLAAGGLVRKTYFDNLRFLADRFGLAKTGGSDAHEEELYSKVWTEFLEPIESAGDFIRALKEGAVNPGYDRSYFNIGSDV
jgi:hypothetical protein